MNVPDLINALYEGFGGLFVLNHCRVLYRDKVLKGVSIVSITFFTTWGIWNIWYYPHLGQWASFVGGLFITVSNALWVGMMIYYSRKNTK